MQQVASDSGCQGLAGKRPLPLGEGWGEGLATKPKILFLLSLLEVESLFVWERPSEGLREELWNRPLQL